MNEKAILELKFILEEMKLYQEKLSDKYDIKVQNEPETDSAYERWEESLGSLEEKIDELIEINEMFEGFIDSLTENKKEELEYAFNKYEDWNSSYSGITKQVNKLEKLIN